MSNIHRYLLYTLSAEMIIKYCETKKDGPYIVKLNDRFIFDSVVKSQDYMDDNAYLYQMIWTVAKKDTEGVSDDGEQRRLKERETFSKYRKDTDRILLDKVFILDFNKMFPGHATHGEKILNKGIKVILPDTDNKTVLFEAFDKSSSMAKRNRILFVDTKYKSALFNRLMLGIDFKAAGVQAIRSKLYAYRGLFLTDATRVEASFPDYYNNSQSITEKQKETYESIDLNKTLCFDMNTVLVISDSKYDCDSKDKDVERIIAEPAKDEEGKDTDDRGRKKWKIYIDKQKAEYNINPYDGEGLICKAYADLINEQLDKKNKGATSFQIRMPYVKGMLHQVEFCELIQKIIEKSDCNQSKESNQIAVSDLYIDDYFGIKRKIADARIILTESMFKCAKWLKQYCKKRGIEDPMAFYFSRMREFDHSLYISQTNTIQVKNTGLTSLNYQFINPMAFSQDKFQHLIDVQNTYIQEMSSDPVATFFKTNVPQEPSEDNTGNDDNKTEDDSTTETISNKTWVQALKTNEHLIKDKFIKQKLINHQITLIKNISEGHFLVNGEMRYLSGDLLGLIKDMISKSYNDDIEKERIKLISDYLEEQCLYSDEFYLPKSKLTLIYDKEYAFLRNPHLSRYEEFLLQPKRNTKAGETNYYKEFFGHLEGIVIVGRKSLAPTALGGADFDGDFVRIVEDDIVKEAIKDGTKTKREGVTKSNSKGYLKRKLPYISIPSPKAGVSSIEEKIDPKTIIDTFSNQVGIISNATVRYGQIEYSGDSDQIYWIRLNGDKYEKIAISDDNSLCAEGCILVGLELDANKNGVHPSLEVFLQHDKTRKQYIEQNNKNQSANQAEEKDYIYYKKIMDTFNFYDKSVFEVTEKNDSFLVNYGKGKSEKIEIPRSENHLKIDRLPEECLNSYKKYFSEKTFAKKQLEDAKKDSLFWFSPKFNKDESMINKIKLIFDSYNQVKKEVQNAFEMIRKYKDAKYFSRINLILTLQYASGREAISNKSSSEVKEKVQVALKAYQEIESYIHSFDKQNRDSLLNRIISKKWMFVRKEDRENVLVNDIFKGKDNLSDDVIRLLTNFENDGFNILYYLVKDIYYLSKTSDLKELATASTAVKDTVHNEEYLQKYHAQFIKAFSNKMIQGEIDRMLLGSVKEDLSALFSDEKYLLIYHSGFPDGYETKLTQKEKIRDAEMAYLYSLRDKSVSIRNIFWSFFDWDDFNRNLIGTKKIQEIMQRG